MLSATPYDTAKAMEQPRKARRARGCLWSALPVLLLLSIFCAPRPAAAQSVSDLVTSPPLIKVEVGSDWSYDTELLLNNTYNAIKKDDYVTAAQLVQRLMDAVPDNVQVLQLAVHIDMKQQDWSDADLRLSRLLALMPDNVPARVRRGFVRSQMKNFESAVTDYETALASQTSPELKAYIEKALADAKAQTPADTKTATAPPAQAASPEEPAVPPAQVALPEQPAVPPAQVAGPDWTEIQKTETELRAKNDWPALDIFYAELAERYPDLAYAYSARGYLSLSQNRFEEARRDFTRAIPLETNPEAVADYKAALAQIEQQEAKAEDLKALAAADSRLRREGDQAGLERLYDGYARKYPDDYRLRARLGYARLDLGQVGEGRTDLEAALRLNPDEESRKTITNILEQTDPNRPAPQWAATPLPPKTPTVATPAVKTSTVRASAPIGDPVEPILARADERLRNKQYDTVAPLLAPLASRNLERSQAGRRDFFLAEALRGQQRLDEAQPLYHQALANLPNDFYRSETYARLAEYALKQGQAETSREYIDQALVITPDFEWRNSQAGDIYMALNRPEEALSYYEKALPANRIALEDTYFYGAMARAELSLGDREKFDTYMRRHIDSAARRLSLSPDPTGVADEELRRLKKSFTDMSKVYGGSLYSYYNHYDNGDYMSGLTAEVKRTQTLFGYRTELYGKYDSTLVSAYSGTYFDPVTMANYPYSGRSTMGDNSQLAIGGRIFLTDGYGLYGLYVGLEQNFKVGRYTENDTRLILNLFEALGNDWEPVKSDWTFASIYSQLYYSFNRNDFIYGGDTRLGRSFRLDDDGLWTLTPFAGATFNYGGEDVDKGSRWGLEAGPGVFVRRWFAEPDPYKVPTTSFDFALQYRFGLSHEREDVLSASIYCSF